MVGAGVDPCDARVIAARHCGGLTQEAAAIEVVLKMAVKDLDGHATAEGLVKRHGRSPRQVS
jgi:hypothetical protein